MNYYVSNSIESKQGKAANAIKVNKVNGRLQIVDEKQKVISRENG
jgi:hypothetical protein